VRQTVTISSHNYDIKSYIEIQSLNYEKQSNWLYAQLHYLLNFSQLLVSCLSLLDKPINPGVSDYCCRDFWGQTHLN